MARCVYICLECGRVARVDCHVRRDSAKPGACAVSPHSPACEQTASSAPALAQVASTSAPGSRQGQLPGAFIDRCVQQTGRSGRSQLAVTARLGTSTHTVTEAGAALRRLAPPRPPSQNTFCVSCPQLWRCGRAARLYSAVNERSSHAPTLVPCALPTQPNADKSAMFSGQWMMRIACATSAPPAWCMRSSWQGARRSPTQTRSSATPWCQRCP